jgi:L-ascorbate metabolism protein UlaG (beta-lactamase superfamily)
MTITWLGHACFKIQDKNVTIITDPYDPSIGLKLPRLAADIVTVSHDHYDHNNIGAIRGVNGEPFVIKNPGEYELKGVFIYGLPSWHDKSEGKERGTNTIYRIEMEDISLVHLGDLGHILNEDQIKILEGVDILCIPVGGVYTINAKEAAEVISQIEPRIVIPMHYKIPGLKINIDPIDKFAREMGVSVKEKLPKLKVSQKDLPQEETKIIILECAH